MNIGTSKVIKLKLHVSVPGWPEKTCPKKPRREKGQEIWDGPGTPNVPRQDSIYIYIYINRLLKITKPAKAKI